MTCAPFRSSGPTPSRPAVLAVRGLGVGTWEWIALLSARAHSTRRAGDRDSSATSVGANVSLDPSEASELLRLAARRFASDERVLGHALREYLDDEAA